MIPNITGEFRANVNVNKWTALFNGAFYQVANLGGDTKGSSGNDMHHYTYGFDASRVSSVYTSNAGIVVPSALFIPGWIIKY